MYLSEYVTNEIPTLERDKLFLVALTLMDEIKVSYLPIVEKDIYLGLVPENIIYEFDLFNKPISDFVRFLKPLFITPDKTLLDALSIFVSEKVDVLPVVDEKNKYIGVLTRPKLMEGLSLLLSAGEQGGILVLTMNYNDLYISEIARIVEDNEAKIMTLFVIPVYASTEVKVIIKVNKTDVIRIKKSFLRYNYTIEVIGVDVEDESLSHKYALFMKYLDI